MKRCDGLRLVVLFGICSFLAGAVKQKGGYNLQIDRYSTAYRLRLVKAGQAFAEWCAHRNLHLASLVTVPASINRALIDYIQHNFSTDAPLWMSVHAVLAIQVKWRPLKGCLRPAWDSIQSWRMTKQVKSRVRMVWTSVGDSLAASGTGPDTLQMSGPSIGSFSRY